MRYLSNPLTNAIVIGGLEPFEQFDEVVRFLFKLREVFQCNDDVVIYTGYTKEECEQNGWLERLSNISNVTVKFGRYIPNRAGRYDDVLGVTLASDNQYAEKIS